MVQKQAKLSSKDNPNDKMETSEQKGTRCFR